MRKNLKKKLTGSMFITVFASIIIISVCLLLGITRYSSVRFSHDVAAVFTSEFLMEMNEAANGTPESAAQSVSELIDVNASQLGIAAGREYSIWDAESGTCVGGTQTDVDITNNIVTAMNGAVGDSMPLLKVVRDIAVPVTGNVELVVDIRDDGSFMQNLYWNIFGLLFVALVLSLAMCLVLSNIFAGAFADAAIQTAKRLYRAGELPVDSFEEGWELIALYEPASPSLRRRRRKHKPQTDALDTASQYISEGYVKFTSDGTVLQINAAAVELLNISHNAENLTFNDVFSGVPIPTEKQKMVHGEFTRENKRLDVVFIAQENGIFAAIVRPAVKE